MELRIYRYNPDQENTRPYMQSYNINPRKLVGIMLLDALEDIKTRDSSLSFRRSCGGGVCGSDGMNINGVNGLACMTTLESLPDVVEIRPLPSFPVIRDLVVDMSNFYKQYEKIKPFLRYDSLPEKEFIQSTDERKLLDGLYECILCACCSSSCPSYWWNPDKFIGPAGLLWACRFIMDSRDTTTDARLDELAGLYELYRCHSIMNCASVCPKGLNPGGAISNIRGKMLQTDSEN